MRARTLRRNFVWNLGGNIVYNAVQWLLIVFIARLGTKDMVGTFALAQALAAPIFLAVGLNLRIVRATDVRRVWQPFQYKRLRAILNVASILLTLLLGLVLDLGSVTLAVLAMICLGKASEATSQALYGYFQLRDRLDLVSRSLLLRALFGSIGFVAALLATDSLVWACAGLAAGWFVTWLVHDRPAESRLLATEPSGEPSGTMRSLARKAAPLGIDAGVVSVVNNVPRYGVQWVLGTSALGAFAALAYLGRVVMMVTGSMADTVIARLARQADSQDVRGFLRLLAILVAFGLGVSGAGLLGAWLLGEPVIRFVLGPEYVNQPVLMWLMVGVGITAFQRCLSRGLQAGHKFYGVLLIDVITLIGTVLAAVFLIPAYGLPGAAATLGIGFACGTVATLVQMLRFVTRMRDQPELAAEVAR